MPLKLIFLKIFYEKTDWCNGALLEALRYMNKASDQPDRAVRLLICPGNSNKYQYGHLLWPPEDLGIQGRTERILPYGRLSHPSATDRLKTQTLFTMQQLLNKNILKSNIMRLNLLKTTYLFN